MEEYKVIESFPDYVVSRSGHIYTKAGKQLKEYVYNGYPVVYLSKPYISKSHRLHIHRLVASAFIANPENKRVVDHINNNRCDNSVSNLRWCTHQENLWNSPLSKRNSTGVKGVYFNKKFNNWKACICHNYQIINLGYFDTIEEAIEARQNKANELFGEYINKCECSNNNRIEINIKIK